MTKRAQLTQNKSSNGIKSIACGLEIPPSGDHIELWACQCLICPECFLSKICSHDHDSADRMGVYVIASDIPPGTSATIGIAPRQPWPV
eukprot:scaffold119971_cov36-Cyclotella_meneghiniana.AAC.1